MRRVSSLSWGFGLLLGCTGKSPATVGDQDRPDESAARNACILTARSPSEAYQCNHEYHPDWPTPSGRYEGLPTSAVNAAPPRPTSLCEAAARGDMSAVQGLLADAEQRTSLCPDGLGEHAQLDALMAASVFGQLPIVRLLVEQGFDPLKPDNTGRSSYVWAASGNHPEVVEFFWQRGIRPAVKDAFIGAVLYSAGLWDRQEILEYYIAESVDLNADHYGHTAVMGAAQGGHLELVKWLVDRGANPHDALKMARRFDHGDVADYLQSVVQGVGATQTQR